MVCTGEHRMMFAEDRKDLQEAEKEFGVSVELDRCSNLSCEKFIPVDSLKCPKCGVEFEDISIW